MNFDSELTLRIFALIAMVVGVYGGIFLFVWLPGRAKKKQEQKSKES